MLRAESHLPSSHMHRTVTVASAVPSSGAACLCRLRGRRLGTEAAMFPGQKPTVPGWVVRGAAPGDPGTGRDGKGHQWSIWWGWLEGPVGCPRFAPWAALVPRPSCQVPQHRAQPPRSRLVLSYSAPSGAPLPSPLDSPLPPCLPSFPSLASSASRSFCPGIKPSVIPSLWKATPHLQPLHSSADFLTVLVTVPKPTSWRRDSWKVRGEPSTDGNC